eukprot:4595648-Amphidinium_carterae.1
MLLERSYRQLQEYLVVCFSAAAGFSMSPHPENLVRSLHCCTSLVGFVDDLSAGMDSTKDIFRKALK